jgi:hypothetical protein
MNNGRTSEKSSDQFRQMPAPMDRQTPLGIGRTGPKKTGFSTAHGVGPPTFDRGLSMRTCATWPERGQQAQGFGWESGVSVRLLLGQRKL